MNRAFETLSTKHKQTNFFKDNGDFVEPVTIKDQDSEKIIGCIVPFKPKLTILLYLPELEVFSCDHMDILKAKNIKCLLSDGTYIKGLIEKVFFIFCLNFNQVRSQFNIL